MKKIKKYLTVLQLETQISGVGLQRKKKKTTSELQSAKKFQQLPAVERPKRNVPIVMYNICANLTQTYLVSVKIPPQVILLSDFEVMFKRHT